MSDLRDTHVKRADQTSAPGTTGRVIHSAFGYDFIVWLLMRGREGAFRERQLDLARLRPGERVLDVGCGTGTLAIAARLRVGAAGVVHGIDPSPQMIARATKKARKAGADVVFRTAVAEHLPFPDAHFDLVLCSMMLHHLPKKVRAVAAGEMRRVLRPGGRILAVDFGNMQEKKGLIAHFHRHGHVKLDAILEVLGEVGFTVVESGPVGVRDLSFALGTAPPAAS